MAILSIDEIPEGAVTAGPVTDPRGQVLVQKGTTLAGPMIEKLKGRGVTKVDVVAEESPEELAKRRGGIEARLERMFAPHREDPVMAAIEKVTRSVLLPEPAVER